MMELVYVPASKAGFCGFESHHPYQNLCENGGTVYASGLKPDVCNGHAGSSPASRTS